MVDPPEPPRLRVLTQNVYVGAGLLPAIAARDVVELAAAVRDIHATVAATDFPGRARALAAILAGERPDVVGLQEVARWTVAGPSAAPVVDLDFLRILRTALAERGLRYDVAAVAHHADLADVPLGESTLRLRNRDVVLVRADGAARATDPRTGRFSAQELVDSPLGRRLSFDRGWASVELVVGERAVRFVDTHLALEQFPEVQEAQVEELLLGPAGTSGDVVLVGDLNAAVEGHRTRSYERLVSAGFADAWAAGGSGAGFTCCQEPDLANPVSSLAARIDYVLVRGGIQVVEAHLVGDRPYQDVAPRWVSDHAGVLATLALG